MIPSTHDPDEKGDDEWGAWASGFIYGLIAAGVLYLLIRLTGCG